MWKNRCKALKRLWKFIVENKLKNIAKTSVEMLKSLRTPKDIEKMDTVVQRGKKNWDAERPFVEL